MTPDPSMMMAGGGGPDLSLMQMAVYGFLIMIGVLMVLTLLAVLSLPVFFGALAVMQGLLNIQRWFPPLRVAIRLGIVAYACVALVFMVVLALLLVAAVPFLLAFGLAFVLPLPLVALIAALLPVFALAGVVVALVSPPSADGSASTVKAICLWLGRSLIGLVASIWELFLGLLDLQQETATLVFRSLRRNLLRTALTYVALFVLTGMLTFIYAIVKNLGELTADKEGSQLVIMTEKYGIPSQLPPGYAARLKGLIRDRLPKNLQPADLDANFMTWTFVGAAIDPNKSNPENNFFLFCLDPQAISSGMMKEQGLSREDLGEEDWNKLLALMTVVQQDKRNIMVGEDRLKVMNKQVGETLTFTSTNYRELVFEECRIVASFPSGGRLGNAAVMRYDFLQAKIDEYKRTKNKDHPLAGSALNLIWVRLPSKQAFEQLAQEVAKPDSFPDKAAKLETFSAAIGTFLEPFKDIFWGMKWIIMPAIVCIMCLVIGITITIGVRERRAEMAVLKVLGFQPRQVQAMVVSESVLIGVYGGMLATWTVYFLPLVISAAAKMGGGKIAFFDNFKSDPIILLYGPLLGIAVGLIGAWMPSRAASKVKVSEVFAQVA